MSLARVVIRCMRSTIRSFMGKQSRADRYQVQGLLSACFQMRSHNSLGTGHISLSKFCYRQRTLNCETLSM
jgi:hypothetical protein